jgi:putative FmdB family regulatory protein
MPTYEYVCRNCGHKFEELQSMSEDPLVRCPSCGKDTLARIMGTGSGLIFKGSGFYLTDYKKTSTPPSTDSERGKKTKPAKGDSTPPSAGTPDKKE